MRAAMGVYETGQVGAFGHTTAFIGQLGLVQPFLWLSGGQPWAFTAFGLVMAGLGIACTYLLARRFVGIGSAVMVVLLVLAFPGFARSSASFMTDVPTYALIMLCLLLGTRSGDDGWARASLVASVAVGVLATSIREFALAAPLAVLIAAWVRSWPRHRLWLYGVAILLAVGVIGILAVSSAVPGHGGVAKPQLGGLVVLGPAFATLAAVLLPATVLALGRRMTTLSREQIIVVVALACLLVFDPNGPILGNIWTQQGLAANNVLAGFRAPLIGNTGWAVSRQVVLLAAILAAVAALSWIQPSIARVTDRSSAWAAAKRIVRSREGPLVLFLLGYAAELALFSLLGGLFDRYLYPMVPVAAILLLRQSAQRRSEEPFHLGRSHALSHGAFAWLVASAFIIAANSFAYDAARFREGDAAVGLGYDATTVDAGYEWVGIHAVGDENETFEPKGLNWWQNLFPSFRPCAILSNAPFDVPGYELVRENPSAYRQYLLFGPAQPLYLYGAHLDGCPTPQPVELTSGG